MLVLTVKYESDKPFPMALTVNYLQEVFMEVTEYTTTSEGDMLSVYFPQIVIDPNPIYDTILDGLTTIYLRNRYDITRDRIWFDTRPSEATDGIPELSKEILEVSAGDIQDCTRMPPTDNNLLNMVDEFKLLLLYIKRMDRKVIEESLLYISSAYFWNEKRKNRLDRSESAVDQSKWIAIIGELGVNEETAMSYFDNAEKYSYTTITVEEIIRRHSREMEQIINEYREARIKQKIRRLFNFHQFPDAPSDNELWQTFAEFVRKDHFYADGCIYMLDQNYCRKITATEMRPVINIFVMYVNEVKLSLKYGGGTGSVDAEKLDTRYQRIVKQFESKTSAKFAADAVENYGGSRLRNEMQSKAIPFKDTVVVYDQGKVHMRKAFMEDQFTSTANVSVLGFGRLPTEIRALGEVKNALSQIFVHKENVDWFIRWCGSLLTHNPERTCLFMYGPKGGNAKTTIANVLLQIFGGWGVQCRPDLLAPGGKASGCTPFEVELLNKVLAVISEPQKGMKYSSSTLKDITGSDRKKGAAKYKDPIEFEQTAKPMILCNAIPEFDEVDLAFIDRVFILRCIGRYMRGATAEDAKDHLYPRDDTFWKDATRIRALAHLIVNVGLPEYLEKGLAKTSYQEEEVLHWRKDVCPFARFLDTTQRTHEGKRVYTESHQVYGRFKMRNSMLSLSHDDFVLKFKEATGSSPREMAEALYYPFYVQGTTGHIFEPM